jgi:hypothetical protein
MHLCTIILWRWYWDPCPRLLLGSSHEKKVFAMSKKVLVQLSLICLSNFATYCIHEMWASICLVQPKGWQSLAIYAQAFLHPQNEKIHCYQFRLANPTSSNSQKKIPEWNEKDSTNIHIHTQMNSAHWPQKVTFDLFPRKCFRLGAGSSLALQYWLTHTNCEDSCRSYICIATSSTSAHTY